MLRSSPWGSFKWTLLLTDSLLDPDPSRWHPMSESPHRPVAGLHARYPARLLVEAAVSEQGISFGGDEERSLIGWERVLLAFAAEVGEPEGVRTIVFDLVVAGETPDPQGDGANHQMYRLDADPGEDAMELARAIERGLGSERPSPSIKSVAVDGVPSRWYPDLEAFEEAVRDLLR